MIIEGQVWDESNVAALAAAEREHLVYVHPFADRDVIAGQGTIGLEILADTPDIDAVIVAIGGGGLISGVAAAIKAVRPTIKVIGVEPTGAPTLYESVRAGKVIEFARDHDTSRHARAEPQRRYQCRDRAGAGRRHRPGQR